MGSQTFPQLWILRLADETNCDEGGLFQLIGACCNALNQVVHQLWPFVTGKLDGGDRNDKLSSRLAGPGIFGRESLQRQLLDLRLYFGADSRNPSLLYLP